MKKLISFMLALCLLSSNLVFSAYACDGCLSDSFAYHGRGQIGYYSVTLQKGHNYTEGAVQRSDGRNVVIAGGEYVTFLYMYQNPYTDSNDTQKIGTWYQVRVKDSEGDQYVGWIEGTNVRVVPGYEDMSLGNILVN